MSDLSKYEKIKKVDDITIYKYSDLRPLSNHKLVYEYFYDKTDDISYNASDAYIILFCGKIGEGKTTAINAFFNIIKGINLKDNYRFVLVTESQKKQEKPGSQTEGVHLYYLKDKYNKPVILIDSQGYGDSRGNQYDEMLDDAFRYVFSNVIDHINIICFISKSNNNRLDILIILNTFANKETMVEGPEFVETIKYDSNFINIQKRMEEKWWYALDSKCVLENGSYKIAKYSFDKMTELYEVKVKKIKPKSIKKCAEILTIRIELKYQVNNLERIFGNLLIEQDNLQQKKNIEKEEKLIQEKIHEITREILIILLKLKNYYGRINDIAMNNNHNKTLVEYIDYLKDEIHEKGYNDNEQLRILKKIKKNNEILQDLMKLDIEKLFKLNDNELIEKLKNIILK